MSLSRDAGTGDYALEAGALVLADQGRKGRGNIGLKNVFVSVLCIYNILIYYGGLEVISSKMH